MSKSTERDETMHEDVEVDEDGLTAAERTYLETPISQMNADQRMIALQVKDKKTNAARRQNEEFRRLQAERDAKKKKKAA